MGATHDADFNPFFAEIAGNLTLTPTSSSMNGGVALTLPYYLVPRARSNIIPLMAGRLSPSHPNTKVLVSNILGGITGTADFYALGLQSRRPQGVTLYDTRAVGVQSIFVAPDTPVLVFAINTFERFSAANLAEWDVLIDRDGDGKPDFMLIGADNGFLTTGSLDGQFTTAFVDLSTGDGFIGLLADAPTDGSTVLLPVFASDIGLDPVKYPRFSYTVSTRNLGDNTTADMPGRGKFNAFSPSITQADAFTELDRNKLALVPISIDPKEWKKTPALGLLVISEDNKSGDEQGFLLPVDK